MMEINHLILQRGSKMTSKNPKSKLKIEFRTTPNLLLLNIKRTFDRQRRLIFPPTKGDRPTERFNHQRISRPIKSPPSPPRAKLRRAQCNFLPLCAQ